MLSTKLIQGFVGSILSKRYDNPTPIPEFHKELWETCCSSHPLVAIAAPRAHGKSTAVSHAYALSAVLFRDRRFILLISDTETQAVNFLNDIKQDLKDNEDLIELFGIKGFKKDTETDIIVEMTDGHTFRILVRGAEQKVRGLKWEQMRPDLIICDDLENEEAVANKDRREKFRRWFNGALLPCRARHGIVRIVGTVMHLDSLLNRLLPEDSAKTSVITPLRTYSTLKKPEWKSIRYRAHDPEFENLLWPEMYDREFFESKKEDMTNQGIPEVYAQEYLNYPIDESTSYFKRQDFVDIFERDLKDIKERKKPYNYVVGCDLAVSTKDRSDYSVFVVGAVDDKGIINIIDVRKGRWDSLQTIDEMFAIQKMYNPDWFSMEKGTIEKSIGPIIRVEMVKRRNYINFDLHTANNDKPTRARPIQARLRSGGIKFDKSAYWYSELEDEMVRFPKSRHDDQVDALAWMGQSVNKVHTALTPEEEEEEEYAEFVKQQEEGRSSVTGY